MHHSIPSLSQYLNNSSVVSQTKACGRCTFHQDQTWRWDDIQGSSIVQYKAHKAVERVHDNVTSWPKHLVQVANFQAKGSGSHIRGTEKQFKRFTHQRYREGGISRSVQVTVFYRTLGLLSYCCYPSVLINVSAVCLLGGCREIAKYFIVWN